MAKIRLDYIFDKAELNIPSLCKCLFRKKIVKSHAFYELSKILVSNKRKLNMEQQKNQKIPKIKGEIVLL